MSRTAAQILSIPIDEPGRLFSSAMNAKREYHELLKSWHSDLSRDPRANEVTAHINVLWAEAERQIELNTWHTPGVLTLRNRNNRVTILNYRKKHAFELGTCYYGDSNVLYMVRQEYADLFNAARKAIADIRYQNDEVRKRASILLPRDVKTFETVCDHCVMVIPKTEDVYRMDDLIRAYPPGTVHAAWMISRMHYIACVLEHSGIMHGDISMETMFVSPKHHTCLLLGGWWYAAKEDARINALPTRTHRYAPRHVTEARKASTRVNQILLRQTGLDLLGDPSGRSLKGSVPQAVLDHLILPPGSSAINDYATWQDTVMPRGFGARRFTEFKVDSAVIYKE